MTKKTSKKTLGIVALDMDCSAKNALKNVGGKIPAYFTVIDPYCRQLAADSGGIMTDALFDEILDKAAVEIEQRMAPKSRIIMPLFDNVYQLPAESRQKLQDFITALGDSGYFIYLCIPDKRRFTQDFPDLKKSITDNILGEDFFADPELSIPFMQKNNALAEKYYALLQRMDHATPVAAKPLTFSAQSRSFPTNNHELNQTVHFIVSIVFCISMMIVLCKRRPPKAKLRSS